MAKTKGIDIFDLPPETVVITKAKELVELYELGVYRGIYDTPNKNKCVCQIEVVEEADTNE